MKSIISNIFLELIINCITFLLNYIRKTLIVHFLIGSNKYQMEFGSIILCRLFPARRYSLNVLHKRGLQFSMTLDLVTDGYSSTLTFDVFNHSVTALALCLTSLSYWNQHPRLSFSFHPSFFKFPSKILLLSAIFIIHSMRWSVSTPAA